MHPHQRIACPALTCPDVRHDRFAVSRAKVDPRQVSIILVSEGPAPDAADDYDGGVRALHAETTVQAFRDAGVDVSSIDDIRRLGVYLTTAIKCAKRGYGISRATVEACSQLLEIELELFPYARALLLMGDVAKSAVNTIARRHREPRVIPAGATYRLRDGVYTWRGMRVFPSYVQAGPSFFIEQSKRRMIAQDIAAALAMGAGTGRSQ